jgi:hypothetical protein
VLIYIAHGYSGLRPGLRGRGLPAGPQCLSLGLPKARPGGPASLRSGWRDTARHCRAALKPSEARQGRLAAARSEPVPGLIGERARAGPSPQGEE